VVAAAGFTRASEQLEAMALTRGDQCQSSVDGEHAVGDRDTNNRGCVDARMSLTVHGGDALTTVAIPICALKSPSFFPSVISLSLVSSNDWMNNLHCDVSDSLVGGFRYASYPLRLCRSAWVGFSSKSVCLSICLSAAYNSKTNDPKVFKLGKWNDLGISYK